MQLRRLKALCRGEHMLFGDSWVHVLHPVPVSIVSATLLLVAETIGVLMPMFVEKTN